MTRRIPRTPFGLSGGYARMAARHAIYDRILSLDMTRRYNVREMAAATRQLYHEFLDRLSDSGVWIFEKHEHKDLLQCPSFELRWSRQEAHRQFYCRLTRFCPNCWARQITARLYFSLEYGLLMGNYPDSLDSFGDGLALVTYQRTVRFPKAGAETVKNVRDYIKDVRVRRRLKEVSPKCLGGFGFFTTISYDAHVDVRHRLVGVIPDPGETWQPPQATAPYWKLHQRLTRRTLWPLVGDLTAYPKTTLRSEGARVRSILEAMWHVRLFEYYGLLKKAPKRPWEWKCDMRISGANRVRPPEI